MRRLLIERDTAPVIPNKINHSTRRRGPALDLRFAPTERQPLQRTFVGMGHAEFR